MNSKSLLEAEHHVIDGGIATFRASLAGEEPKVSAMREASALLRRHIYAEEELVFPKLRAGNLAMAVFVMLRDHGALWEALDAIDAKLDAGSRAGLDEALDALVALLQKHNGKEEIVLYAELERALDPATAERLASFLRDGALPEGWVAAKAPGGAGTDGMFGGGFRPPFGRG